MMIECVVVVDRVRQPADEECRAPPLPADRIKHEVHREKRVVRGENAYRAACVKPPKRYGARRHVLPHQQSGDQKSAENEKRVHAQVGGHLIRIRVSDNDHENRDGTQAVERWEVRATDDVAKAWCGARHGGAEEETAIDAVVECGVTAVHILPRDLVRSSR